MKKRIFKFGAALTAALMMFSATASLAFADEAVVEEPETTVEEVVEETVVEEEAVVEDVEEAEEADVVEVEVEVPLETKTIEEAEAELAAATEDVETGSVITIGAISATSDSNYYTVSVPFTVENAPDQMTFFVYDITGIANGNNATSFSSTTPVGYVNQYDGATTGTYQFKLSKENYTDESVIVVKIGGTGVEIPDAKSYSLAGSPVGKIGDVDGSGDVDDLDASLILRYWSFLADESELDLSVADTHQDGNVDDLDASAILRYWSFMIDELPVIPE